MYNIYYDIYVLCNMYIYIYIYIYIIYVNIYIYIYIYIYILENLKTIAIHVFCVFCAADLCSEDVFRI